MWHHLLNIPVPIQDDVIEVSVGGRGWERRGGEGREGGREAGREGGEGGRGEMTVIHILMAPRYPYY